MAETIVCKNVEPIDITTLKGVQRDFLIECSVHGRKFVHHHGHHISLQNSPYRSAKVGAGKKNIKK